MQLCYVLLALIVLMMWRRALGVTVGTGQILLHTLIVSNCCCRDSFGRLLPTTGLDFQWMDKNKKRILNIFITLLITVPSLMNTTQEQISNIILYNIIHNT